MKPAHELSWTIPRPGEVIAGKYIVDGQCGRGGLAVVLSAMHAGLDQRVAIKMLLPEWGEDAEIVERFLREGRAATRIRSEHVVRVFDVGKLDSGAPYLVLEYLEGHDLEEVLTKWGSLPVVTAIDWVLQAAEAISEAHAYGIVHRDVKPSNLFLTRRPDGGACIKVIDFGLSKLTDPRMKGARAKLTRPTDVMGSPHYMAPEQMRATCNTDARADLWALGAVLHELLTAQTPFGGDSLPELCAHVLTQPPPPLSSLREDVPPAVEGAVLRCLEKDPEARFANMAELARALAPYGSADARESCTRIENVLERGPSIPSLMPLESSAPYENTRPSVESWPSDANYVVRGQSSIQVVLGSFLLLAGLGVGVFMWMYWGVHGIEPLAAAGVTAPQPTTSRRAVEPTAADCLAVDRGFVSDARQRNGHGQRNGGRHPTQRGAHSLQHTAHASAASAPVFASSGGSASTEARAHRRCLRRPQNRARRLRVRRDVDRRRTSRPRTAGGDTDGDRGTDRRRQRLRRPQVAPARCLREPFCWDSSLPFYG